MNTFTRTTTALSLSAVLLAGVNAWRPAPRPLRSEWCEENVRLPAETGAQPGKFDIDDGHAYLREIIDAVDDPEVSKVTFIGCTQIGKTETTRAIVLSQGEVARAPMMFAGPDQAYAREQRDLIYSIAELCPALRDRVPPERFRNDRAIDLEKCLVYLAWSGSKQRLSGRACRIVLKSEMDRWQGRPGLADERVKAFPGNTTILEEGTPIGASKWLESSYQASDRRVFKVPCPHCGEYQELRFFTYRRGELAGKGGIGGMRDGRGNWRTPEEARKHVHYICIHGCRIDEGDNPAMVRRGVWCPNGQQVNRRGELTGKPTNPGRHRGYRISSLYSNSVTWADVAECYLNSRDTTDGLCGFFNDWLGMGFEPRGETPKWKDLGLRLAGTYPRRAVPSPAYFLTAAADVQLRGVYWSIRAWGAGKTSWLIDWGHLPKRQPLPDDDTQEQLASDLAQLDATVLDRYWDVAGENPMGHSRLAVRVLGVDCGYRPNDVYAYVRAHPGDRVLAVRGDPKITPGSLWRLSKLERNARTGKIYPEGTQAWGIETNAYKTEIADRWMADRTQSGAWWLPEDILTTEGGEDYLRQITAESRRAEILNGRKVLRWDLISHGADNHYFDTEVYCCCLADMVTGQQWDASAWAPPKRRPSAAEHVSDRGGGRNLQDDFSAR